MRILIADKLAPLVPGQLQDLGASVRVEAGVSGEKLTALVTEYDPHVLCVRSTQVGADPVRAGRVLSLIVRAGAGVNTIDVAAASARGIYVANCPGKNACAVAELAIGHLINLDRRLVDGANALREGRWDKKTFGNARGLNGRTLAILGTGTIGREVIRRAQGLGMRVVAWSRSLSEAQAQVLGVLRAPTPEKAVEGADAVSVHLALTPETRGRIGESVFAAMKNGAYFVNTARGEVVDYDALARALDSKQLRAGLDVFAKEPSAAQAPFEDPLAKHASVYGSHHIGASTAEAEEAVGDEVVRIVDAYRSGRMIPNCVNLASQSEASHLLVVRHADRVGVLAAVLDALREAKHNVQGMQNIVFSGGDAACARIEIIGEPDAATLAKIGVHEAVFDAAVTPLR